MRIPRCEWLHTFPLYYYFNLGKCALASRAVAARQQASAQVDLAGDWEAIARERYVTSEI